MTSLLLVEKKNSTLVRDRGLIPKMVIKWAFGENYGGISQYQLAKKLTKMMTKQNTRV
jgi:hypothetical protein|tara:strand:- start:339 stop:512 length:174 start_codon:yes stop_codon:yes gene_type:complete